jgi:hypothetical protein
MQETGGDKTLKHIKPNDLDVQMPISIVDEVKVSRKTEPMNYGLSPTKFRVRKKPLHTDARSSRIGQADDVGNTVRAAWRYNCVFLVLQHSLALPTLICTSIAFSHSWRGSRGVLAPLSSLPYLYLCIDGRDVLLIVSPCPAEQQTRRSIISSISCLRHFVHHGGRTT